MNSPEIAILGAGPAGLTLARLLLQEDIAATVFEGEPSAHTRLQGGTLDLHVETGQAALKKAGLGDQFVKYARYDGEAFLMLDKEFNKYLEQPRSSEENSDGRPEIDRNRLRQILLDSLPETTIKWDHHVSSVSDDHVIHFSNGTTASGFDLIVGADGAWSKARPLVTTERPAYSGISGLDLTLSNAAECAPKLDALVNNGSMFATSDGRAIIAQHTGAGELRIYAFSQEVEGWPVPGSGGRSKNFDLTNPAAVRQALQEVYTDWHPELKKFLQTWDEDKVRQWSLFQLPVNHRWEHRPGVTLIGDAAHLMTVFAGEGVNQAMRDSLDLATEIADAVTNKSSLDEAVRRYEQGMFPRAHAVMAESDQHKNMFFQTGPAKEWLPKVVAMMGPPPDEDGEKPE